jgi:hypothetical protein
MAEQFIVRKSVLWFARQMEKRLQANDHKGGWDDEPTDYLIQRLKDEVAELEETLIAGKEAKTILEAADVGNFAMMLADQADKKLQED